MRNFSDVEKIKTGILCWTFFLGNHAIYEIMWKNMVEPDRPQMTMWLSYLLVIGTCLHLLLLFSV